jgi:hypothetical protein
MAEMTAILTAKRKEKRERGTMRVGMEEVGTSKRRRETRGKEAQNLPVSQFRAEKQTHCGHQQR